MARQTMKQQSASKTMATGLRVLGGTNVPVYTLQHLTPTQKHSVGEHEKIVIPYIELGRSSSCAVSFGDDCSTVSRKHAAIYREGNEVILKNLSTSNPTLVNGKDVTGEWHLNNGDEIQLSLEGPKMLFNISSTGTAKMGFTNRMNLVVQQAVKPYKNYLMMMCVAIVILMAGSGFFINQLSGDLEKTTVDLQAAQNDLNNTKGQLVTMQADIQSKEEKLQEMQDQDDQNIALIEQTKKELASLKNQFKTVKDKNDSLAILVNGDNSPGGISSAAFAGGKPGGVNNPAGIIKPFEASIYFLETRVYLFSKKGTDFISSSTGTGFLLDDGRFVTARHCVEPWFFIQSGQDSALNIIDHNIEIDNESKVIAEIKAISDDGLKTFTFTNRDFEIDRSKDEITNNKTNKIIEIGQVKMEPGSYDIKTSPMFNDWAYTQTNTKGVIEAGSDLSKNLVKGSKLYTLGYPRGDLYQSNAHNREPIFSENMVAQTGLTNKMIHISNASIDHGNSGGPAFAFNEKGKPVVVGIVSWGTSKHGGFVPISSLK